MFLLSHVGTSNDDDLLPVLARYGNIVWSGTYRTVVAGPGWTAEHHLNMTQLLLTTSKTEKNP
jgi:hypothetical protein